MLLSGLEIIDPYCEDELVLSLRMSIKLEDMSSKNTSTDFPSSSLLSEPSKSEPSCSCSAVNGIGGISR